tara:strand:- start:456 stop:1661 length:1206 start_codon:yes stop_codon:yes gene_type:complete
LSNPKNVGALEGIKVIDFSQILAGPFCTSQLADMGAEVIKVEKPGIGDDTRGYGPPFINGESAAFLTLNRNKKSIVLNLKDDRGLDLARKLITESDVVVQNFRPGIMEKLGLGYEEVKTFNPSLIYCSISGFGNSGPSSQKAGFDIVAQGMSGIMSFTGFPDLPPAKVGVPIADLNTGLFSAFAIVSAYVNRLKTGEGQHIDSALLDSALAYTIYQSADYFAEGSISRPLGSAHPMLAPYQAFKTSDGYINVGAANQRTWELLCVALDREDLLQVEEFSSNANRVTNIEELIPILEAIFVSETTNFWIEVLEKSGVPCGPIFNIHQVYKDPQVNAREMVVAMDHPISGQIKAIGVPVKLSATPGSVRTPAPTLGQHTKEILRGLGLGDAEIDSLHEKSIVE